MRKTSIFFIAISLLMLSSSVLANNATEKSAVIFFEKYISLGDNFDEAVADLYSDNAKISAIRRYPNGLKKVMEIDGSKWKFLVKKSMPLGKARGDISKFTNIKITLKGTKAKIKADRYSELKCYVDRGYYMVIERDKSGNYLIVEEYMETQPQSDC